MRREMARDRYIEVMRALLEKQVNEPLTYDEKLVRRLVEKIYGI